MPNLSLVRGKNNMQEYLMYLRKSRQDKISEYITILTIIKAFEAFNDKGSDKNV